MLNNDLLSFQVYISAILDYVPADMARAVVAFMEFCYIARCNAITTEDLEKMKVALRDFHTYRESFIHTGVRETISWRLTIRDRQQ